jgi:hypothetical protein
MKKFCVRLTGFLSDREEIVFADVFKMDIFKNLFIFVDDQGKPVAMFRNEDVKSINQVPVESYESKPK